MDAMTKRAHGTGGLRFNRRSSYWQAQVILATGKRVTRSRHSEEEARLALEDLLAEYEGRLGHFYQMPRVVRWGQGPKPIRPAISVRVRFAVFERDGFACRYCGASRTDDARLVLDHVLPVVDGGTDDETNLVTACWECNAGKSDRPLFAPVPAIPERVSPP
jgi:5-methylcytosine-specific restriction endonuclease McrA